MRHKDPVGPPGRHAPSKRQLHPIPSFTARNFQCEFSALSRVDYFTSAAGSQRQKARFAELRQTLTTHRMANASPWAPFGSGACATIRAARSWTRGSLGHSQTKSCAATGHCSPPVSLDGRCQAHSAVPGRSARCRCMQSAACREVADKISGRAEPIPR